MECFKNFVTKFINEATEEIKVTDYLDPFLANALYYICRLETNKGPQTLNKYEEYLEGKGIKTSNTSPTIQKTPTEIIRIFGTKEGQRYSLLNDTAFVKKYFPDFGGTMGDLFEKVLRPWHENNNTENPNTKIVAQFFDWYKEKKNGNEIDPPKEVIKFIKKEPAETVEKTFGKYYKFALTQLDKYLEGGAGLSEEEMLIKEFWDWHRAKKNGKPYPMPKNVITGMIKFLKTSKALEVMQQYYYYAVRVIEKLADTVIKTPVNLTGLQKELQRIMDNLDNDKYVDELERIEINRLHGGDMTAGPVFVLPTSVIKSIRTMAKDTKNIDKEKVGKVDKSQVKECYVYCTNELNKKFHVGKTGIFDLNIQDFYDTYKIVFKRGFNTRTLHKIFDEVCQYLLDQLDKGTAEYWKNRGKIEVDEVDDFNEAYKALQSAGYTILKEDKYMDDMDKELDQSLVLNKIVTALKDAGYTKCGIKGDSVYVWPVDAIERYCIVIDEEGLFKDKFYCKVLDREKHRYAAEYYFTIKGDTYKRNGFGGEILAFFGKTEDIVRPGKEYIENAIKPGFFKRLFKNESAEDDALEHGLTPHESANLNVKNRKPVWAKSVKEIGPRKIPLTPSSSYTERAMRSVRGEREPYRETDRRKDDDTRKQANQKLAYRLKNTGLEYDKIYVDKDDVCVFIDKYEFRIYDEGLEYMVQRRVLDNMLDRKTVRLSSLKEVANYIKENV